MVDNQNKYLGKVISLLVRDTRIDNSIILPYLNFPLSYDEIEYVWDQYRGIIKDKIDNGK
tara:strand:+ start:351 stop:530 length:180 start_codon:yes stop_codon:yes gene_type:complete